MTDGPLERARGALAAARELDPGDVQYHDLLQIATVQAQIAQAAALERIADRLDAGAVLSDVSAH